MQLLTKKEVADKCRMTEEWVTEAMGSGKIPLPISLDGNERWKERDIDKWIEAGCPLKQEIREIQTTPKKGNDLDGMETDIDDVNLKQMEKWAIKHALEITKGNREQAAKILGIGERTLYRKIKEFEEE